MQKSSRLKIEVEEENPLDPLQVHELIFQQRLFLPLLQSGQEEVKIQPLVFKIMRAKNAQKLLLYILRENDLYFMYKIEISYETIVQLNEQHSLFLKRLSDFIEFMRVSLDDIQNRDKVGLVEVIKDFDQDLILFTLRKVVGGKSHTVMQLQGKSESEQMIKVHVAFMYGSLRERIFFKQQKIDQLKELVRFKNPYLLKHFKN